MTAWNRRQVATGIGAGLVLAGCASAGIPGIASGPAPKLFYLGQAKVFSYTPGDMVSIALVDHSPKDGSRPQGVNDGIAIHAATGQIYWTNMGRAADDDGYIMRCDKDGSNVATIVPAGGTFTPKQLKIDEAGGKLYWSDREGMAIQRCNLDGSKIETLVVTGNPVTDRDDQSRWCVGMALDPQRGHIYWTQKGGDNSGHGLIRRANMEMPRGATPSNRSDMITLFSRMPEPIDLDLDLSTRTMYWTDRGDNTVSSAPMDPARNYDPATRLDRKILLRGLGEAIGVALDLPRKRLAWTNLEGQLGVANFDGSNPRTLLTGQGLLTGICWG